MEKTFATIEVKGLFKVNKDTVVGIVRSLLIGNIEEQPNLKVSKKSLKVWRDLIEYDDVRSEILYSMPDAMLKPLVESFTIDRIYEFRNIAEVFCDYVSNELEKKTLKQFYIKIFQPEYLDWAKTKLKEIESKQKEYEEKDIQLRVQSLTNELKHLGYKVEKK
jgi:hypothetical protein